MKRFFNQLTFIGGGLLAVYLGVLRPRLARWNASDDEVKGPQPGDELIPQPLMFTNAAVTIQAPAEKVWPWVAQIGYGRGGFYSYDQLERAAGLAGLRSLNHIDPDLQKLRLGDTIKISPVTPMTVEALVPGRALALRIVMSPLTAQPLDRRSPPEPWIDWSWAFIVKPIDKHSCRLISRVRGVYAPYISLWPAVALVLEPASFVMDRKMLLTIKQRAEESK